MGSVGVFVVVVPEAAPSDDESLLVLAESGEKSRRILMRSMASKEGRYVRPSVDSSIRKRMFGRWSVFPFAFGERYRFEEEEEAEPEPETDTKAIAESRTIASRRAAAAAAAAAMRIVRSKCLRRCEVKVLPSTPFERIEYDAIRFDV